MDAQKAKFDAGSSGKVSGLLLLPERARACLLLAHGAGAGMTHPFLEAIAQGLASRGMATFRYQFPYMEKKTRRPDPAPVAEACVRYAVEEAARLCPRLPIFAGGKSFGGRMTSQAQAKGPLPDVRGIVFLGFPLHPSGKPSDARAAHLADVKVPLLFLQGTRDTLAELSLLKPVCKRLPNATLHIVDEADHSFHVPARTGRKDADVRGELEETIVGWADRFVRAG
jgi:predicted alpha/beta-hydrolase family hydrolase